MTVLLLSVVWEFKLEDQDFTIVGVDHEAEALSTRVEFIITSMAFVLLAMILPTWMLVRSCTQRERAEAELHKFKLGIDRSEEVIFLTDLDGTITYVNPSFEKTYGYGSEETLGKTPRILKSDTLPEEVYQEYWSRILEKKVVSGELTNKTKDGRMLTVQSSANPILDDSGNIKGFIAIQHDITERKRAEEERDKLIRELETAIDNVKELSGMLPICASCKKVRDDEGYWHQIETYIKKHSEAEFSHSICPDCVEKLYPDL